MGLNSKNGTGINEVNITNVFTNSGSNNVIPMLDEEIENYCYFMKRSNRLTKS